MKRKEKKWNEMKAGTRSNGMEGNGEIANVRQIADGTQSAAPQHSKTKMQRKAKESKAKQREKERKGKRKRKDEDWQWEGVIRAEKNNKKKNKNNNKNNKKKKSLISSQSVNQHFGRNCRNTTKIARAGRQRAKRGRTRNGCFKPNCYSQIPITRITGYRQKLGLGLLKYLNLKHHILVQHHGLSLFIY